MTHISEILANLRRPRLLIRAARSGVSDYNRDRDLRRLMRVSRAPSPDKALDGLLSEEASLEARRKEGDATYSVVRHVEVLIAVMAEARLLPRPGSPA